MVTMPLPRGIARINRSFTNHLTRPLAGHLPGMGVVTHQGRSSGRTYHTPVNVFRRDARLLFALTYGQGDWVLNVLHAGEASVLTRGVTRRVANPSVVTDPAHDGLPLPVRLVLGLIGADELLMVDDAGPVGR